MIEVVAALGNPGQEYASTRHNAGWLLVDALLQKEKGKWKISSDFNACVLEISIERRKIRLIKPQTFMNLSGEAIAPFLRFYKIKPENLLVIHDEVAFDSGSLKLSLGGSAGGHNGVASVIDSLGTENFWRLRLGVGPRNPLLSLTEWVLGPLSKEEQEWLKSKETLDKLESVLKNEPQAAQNLINQK